jgi:hypothetical protein
MSDSENSINCNGHIANPSDICTGHNSTGINNDQECSCEKKKKLDNNANNNMITLDQFNKDLYNTSLLLLSAGKILKKYNYALGEVVFSLADIVLNDLNSNNQNNQNNYKSFEPQNLSPEIENEINNIIDKLNQEEIE